MKRFYVIVNPVSGRGAGEHAIPRVEESLRAAGLDHVLVRTERPWHAADLAQQASVDGFDTVVGFEAQKLRHLHGFMAYLVGALKTIFLYFEAPLVRIELDGRAITQRALMVSIMNGRRMGGGFLMAPNGQPDDGLLDLCIAAQISRRAVLRLMPRFMKGTQGSHPAITTERASRVTITAEEGTLPAHSDGETLCTAGKRLDVELLAKQIEIIVAAEDGNS